MQDTEHDGSACEERHDEGHYHADEEALRAAFDVVGGIAADRTGNKYEQSRKDIPYHIEPAVEENRNIQTEQVFQVVHGVVDHHADYGKSGGSSSRIPTLDEPELFFVLSIYVYLRSDYLYNIHNIVSHFKKNYKKNLNSFAFCDTIIK